MTDPVITSIISASAAILAVIVTSVFEEFRKKGEFKRMNRHEVYQRRMALYEEVIQKLSSVIEPDEANLRMSDDEFNAKITELQHTLLLFINRLHIYGSPRSIELLKLLIAKLREPTAVNIPVYAEGSQKFHKSLPLRVELSLTEFAKAIREEIGIDSIDEEIRKDSAKNKKQKKNKP
jgi:hypothetical protein